MKMMMKDQQNHLPKMQVYIKSMLYEFDPTIVGNNFRTLYLAGFCHFYTEKKSCEPESPRHRHQAKGHI